MAPHFEQIDHLRRPTGKAVLSHQTDTDSPTFKEPGTSSAHGAHKDIKKLVIKEKVEYVEVGDEFGEPCETHPHVYSTTSGVGTSG